MPRVEINEENFLQVWEAAKKTSVAPIEHGRPAGGAITGCGLSVDELLAGAGTVAPSWDRITCQECLLTLKEWRGLECIL